MVQNLILYLLLFRSAVDQLKVWLDKTPFKSSNANLKNETFYGVLNAVMQLKAGDIDSICGPKGSLSDKLAMSLSKYLFKAMELIGQQDKRKSPFCLLTNFFL